MSVTAAAPRTAALPAGAVVTYCGCGAPLVEAVTGAVLCAGDDACDMAPTWADLSASAAEDGMTVRVILRGIVLVPEDSESLMLDADALVVALAAAGAPVATTRREDDPSGTTTLRLVATTGVEFTVGPGVVEDGALTFDTAETVVSVEREDDAADHGMYVPLDFEDDYPAAAARIAAFMHAHATDPALGAPYFTGTDPAYAVLVAAQTAAAAASVLRGSDAANAVEAAEQAYRAARPGVAAALARSAFVALGATAR